MTIVRANYAAEDQKPVADTFDLFGGAEPEVAA